MDTVTEENLDSNIDLLKKLALNLNIIIAVTGKIDIVTDGKTTFVIRNGHDNMSLITGTGCMLSSLLGVFIASNENNILHSIAFCIRVQMAV